MSQWRGRKASLAFGCAFVAPNCLCVLYATCLALRVELALFSCNPEHGLRPSVIIDMLRNKRARRGLGTGWRGVGSVRFMVLAGSGLGFLTASNCRRRSGWGVGRVKRSKSGREGSHTSEKRVRDGVERGREC